MKRGQHFSGGMNMKQTLRPVYADSKLGELADLMDYVKQLVNLNYSALLSYRRQYLDEGERVGKKFDLMGRSLLGSMSNSPDGAVDSGNLLKKIRIISGMKEEQYKLLQLIREKNKDGILFSHKGLAEVKELCMLAEELCIHSIDYLVTGNPLLKKQIDALIQEGSQQARNFSTEHEERLIKGICMPKASNLYLQMMGRIKGHFTHLNLLLAD
jgi:Na+/phosphate symporter